MPLKIFFFFSFFGKLKINTRDFVGTLKRCFKNVISKINNLYDFNINYFAIGEKWTQYFI